MLKILTLTKRVAQQCRNEKGGGHVDTLIAVIISVAIGAAVIGLFLAGLQNDWFPTFSAKILEMLG